MQQLTTSWKPLTQAIIAFYCRTTLVVIKYSNCIFAPESISLFPCKSGFQWLFLPCCPQDAGCFRSFVTLDMSVLFPQSVSSFWVFTALTDPHSLTQKVIKTLAIFGENLTLIFQQKEIEVQLFCLPSTPFTISSSQVQNLRQDSGCATESPWAAYVK